MKEMGTAASRRCKWWNRPIDFAQYADRLAARGQNRKRLALT